MIRPYGYLNLGGFFALALFFSGLGVGQDRDRYGDRDRYRDRYGDAVTRLMPGTVIPVRTTEPIDVERTNYEIYRGVADQDVRGDDGRLAIPRGSPVELIVRVARDNDLILDLESVTVNGERYALKTAPNRVDAQSDNTLIGGIIGALSGVRGSAVRIPRDAVISFRLQRPLDMGVADRGSMRDGRHYHDYYGRPYYRNQ